jgi:hypothetical protein
MWIHLSGWQIVDLGTLRVLIVAEWRSWLSMRTSYLFSCLLSALVWLRFTHSFALSPCLQIHCGAILARQAAIREVFMMHCRVSFYHSFHLPVWRNSAHHRITCWTSAQGFLRSYCAISIAVHKNPPLVILVIFRAKRMSDCSSFTRRPCLAIVADMFKTYVKLVVSKNEIRLLRPPNTFPLHPVRCSMPV